MRIAFILPGLHRYSRGAEIAFISVASQLAKTGDSVTLIGSGLERAAAPYRFLHAGSLRRENFESFPKLPLFRDECAYEELTFIPDLLRHYKPAEYDVTVTCSYPFTNWLLRRPTLRGARPPHIFVTQNGDWPAHKTNSEYIFFGCDGLVCTNPEYYERHKHRWRCCLIPNGVDCDRFFPGPARREDFGLPPDGLIVLMVSALIPSKRVGVAIEALSRVPEAHLVVAGDGPLRQEIDATAVELLPNRYTRLSVTPEKMADLYRSADVFLHLSKNEPSSLAFVEALASGLPSIAHDLPQLRYISGDHAILINTDEPTEIARQIRFAANASPDQSTQRAMRASTFSWANMAAKYRDFLREVIASSKSADRSGTTRKHNGFFQ
jgi:glycosyltransferase involved in cell wall biosynthesis